jgi:hypothetical protein
LSARTRGISQTFPSLAGKPLTPLDHGVWTGATLPSDFLQRIDNIKAPLQNRLDTRNIFPYHPNE